MTQAELDNKVLQSRMDDNIPRVIHILLDQCEEPNLFGPDDIREIFKALPSKEAALLSANVVSEFTISHLVGDDGDGDDFVKKFIGILCDD